MRAPGGSRKQTNPWIVGLTVLWCGLLALALLLLILGGNAAALTYDRAGLPPSQELAGIDYAVSGGIAAVAVIVLATQMAVRAVLWHLDPAVRAVPTSAESPRAARQDF